MWGIFFYGLQYGKCAAEAAEKESREGSSIKKNDASNNDGLSTMKIFSPKCVFIREEMSDG